MAKLVRMTYSPSSGRGRDGDCSPPPAQIRTESTSAPRVDLKELHAKIGQLALENDFLAGALGKAGLLSARK